MIAALITTVLFSFSVVCGHKSANILGGTAANFWRIAVAALFLGIWAFAFGSGLSGVAFPFFLLSGMAGIGFGDVAFFQALPRLGSRLSLLLIECLAPPFGALIEWVWLGTSLSARQVVCGLVILAGVGLALAPGEQARRGRRVVAVGTLFCALAAFGTAAGAVLSRKAYSIGDAASDSPDPMSAAFQRVVGGLLLAAIGLLLVRKAGFEALRSGGAKALLARSPANDRRVWLWVVLNGLSGQTLGVSCMQAALQSTPTGVVLSIIAITPIVVIPFAYFFEAERPSRQSILGALIAIAGVIALVVHS